MEDFEAVGAGLFGVELGAKDIFFLNRGGDVVSAIVAGGEQVLGVGGRCVEGVDEVKAGVWGGVGEDGVVPCMVGLMERGPTDVGAF